MTVSVPTTTAETIIPVPSLTLDQADYLRELRRRETDFDRSIVIGGPRQSTRLAIDR
jgi:hypothetical protein